jgi:predicted GIY-YIG superfamily endonuclease
MSGVFTSQGEPRLRNMSDRATRTFWVYMTASRPHGVIYVGMTSELAGRAWEHRERVMEGFTKRYWVDRRYILSRMTMPTWRQNARS